MTQQPGSSTAAHPDQPVTTGTRAEPDRPVDAGTRAEPDQPVDAAATDVDRKQPVDAGRADERATTDGPGVTAAPGAPGALLLAVLAAGWLTAMLWSTRAAIDSAQAGVTAISLSAYALPGVISAALVAGAGIALAVTNLLTRRGADRATLRFVVAVGAGLLVGSATAVAINLFYADNATTNVIAGSTAAAAVVGGALAGARNAPVVGAVVTGTLAVLVFVVAFSQLRDRLFVLYGGEGTQEAMVDAARWVSRTESLAAGLLAGLLAFGYLRLARRRALRRDPDAPAGRWPGYLVAGAGAGLLLLLTEVIIRIGGRSLLDLAGALSEADAVAQTTLGTSRIDNGIWVLFVGALTALIAFGRTLGPAPAADDEEDADGASAAT
ncbi:hypothetical protein [Micromonospora cathayae]|uniref:Uncharacterized protein n=1 Tax=Micromonospora cathayae TaxID=3028804 RepID=A0ABY7ZVU7_9ACTN|nr:hypothetical protein [Micromonospora sp. HUAS 3]WDZ86998.1 hypothetical protein PVK37_11645 [Micromonospora sp. HUAS 3]